MRECKICKKWKNLEFFCRSGIDNYSYKCRECYNLEQKAEYARKKKQGGGEVWCYK